MLIAFTANANFEYAAVYETLLNNYPKADSIMNSTSNQNRRGKELSLLNSQNGTNIKLAVHLNVYEKMS